MRSKRSTGAVEKSLTSLMIAGGLVPVGMTAILMD